jgi:NAD(P)-dependent dehydrogenase (short-subunit alcohol dehydrogenase family)
MTTDPLFSVADRSVLVAGAAGALGQALAYAFAERGAKIIAADIDRTRVEAVAEKLPGGGHLAHWLDVTDEASCKNAVATARDALGGLDVVINGTGVFSVAPALELDAQTFADTLRVNLTGAFLLARAAASIMIADGGGSIITIASVSSRVANPGYAAYASSKAGLMQLVRVLAREWAEHQVTVNTIGPAMILTPLTEQYLRSTDNFDYALGHIPMGRFGKPEDIVGTALLLASQAGAFVTGQTIFVDGGRTCV